MANEYLMWMFHIFLWMACKYFRNKLPIEVNVFMAIHFCNQYSNINASYGWYLINTCEVYLRIRREIKLSTSTAYIHLSTPAANGRIITKWMSLLEIFQAIVWIWFCNCFANIAKFLWIKRILCWFNKSYSKSESNNTYLCINKFPKGKNEMTRLMISRPI